MNKAGEADEGVDDEPNPEGVEGGDEKNPAPQLPTKDNPAIFALYGHICLAGKSYQSAICACPSPSSYFGVDRHLQFTFSTRMITAQMTR